MLEEKYSKEEKVEIAKQIKNITIIDMKKEMNKLLETGENVSTMSSRSRIGNNIVDYFTFSKVEYQR